MTEQKILKPRDNLNQKTGDPPNYGFAAKNFKFSNECKNGILNNESVVTEMNFDRLEHGTVHFQ